jgi:hypothetical protein
MDKILEERERTMKSKMKTAIMMIVQVEIVIVVIIMIAMDKMIIPVVKAMTVVEITTRRQIGPFQLFFTKYQFSLYFIFFNVIVYILIA